MRARAAQLYGMANRSAAMRSILGAFMSRNALDSQPGKSYCTRTIVDYGVPTERRGALSIGSDVGLRGGDNWRVRHFMKRARDALFDFFAVAHDGARGRYKHAVGRAKYSIHVETASVSRRLKRDPRAISAVVK